MPKEEGELMDTKFKKGDLVRVIKAPYQIGLIVAVGPHPHFKNALRDKIFYSVLWAGQSAILRSSAVAFDALCESAGTKTDIKCPG